MSNENTRTERETVAYKRLEALFDEGTLTSISPYAKSNGDLVEAAAGYGEINGCAAYAFAQNSDICSGAMSKAQAAKIKKLYELALKTGTPVVAVYDSKGARVNEGIEMLTAYGELLNLSGKLAGVVPQVAVVLGSCGGTSALLAATADFVIMSENGKFTISTSGEGGSVDENVKSGTVAIKAKDEFSAIAAAKDIITLLPQNNLSDAYQTEEIPAVYNNDVISCFVDGGSFVELYDGFAQNSKVGFAKLNGDTIGVVVTKGGKLSADDCEKCSKIVRFCDAFSIPVITFADSVGFDNIKSAAKLTAAYAEATTAKITVVSGVAYGAFYMALAGTGASTDVTFALENASISPVNPEAAIIILYPERLKTDKPGREKALEDFKKEECSAVRAAEMGYIDSVVSEEDLRKTLSATLDMLAGKRESTLPKKHSTI